MPPSSATRLFFLVLCAVVSATVFATDGVVVPPRTEAPDRPLVAPEPPFPGMYFLERLETELREERARPYWVASELEDYAAMRRLVDYRSILLNDDVLAFYGTPLSKRMGVLGVYSIPELDRMLGEWAVAYDATNGDRGVRKAFYVIYGMVWPEGEIGLLQEKRLIEYIEYALANDILVFLDHQIGKYSVESAVKRLLPFLRYPNVHLALDPEWRTTKPMQEIGSVTADEINSAQRMIESYLVEHGYPGERLLVVHQFNWKMIIGREQVRTDFARVRLIHCADGFGQPTEKIQAYNYNSLARNMPIKGFKLFFKSGVPGAGFDEPLMNPADVLNLTPRPTLIMYQ